MKTAYMITATGEREDGSVCQFATGAVYTDRSHVLAAIAMIEGDDAVGALVTALENGNKVEVKDAKAAIRSLELPQLTVDGKPLDFGSLGRALRKGDGRVSVQNGDEPRYVIWEMALNAWPPVGDDAAPSDRWYDNPERWTR